MQRFTNWFAWLVVAVVVALSILNWETLTIAAPLNLVVLSINAPLGLVLIGVSGVLVVLFFLATLHNQIGSLRETGKLNKEIQRLQAIIDRTQITTLDTMRAELKEEFGALQRRFDLLPEVSRTLSQPPETATQPTTSVEKPVSVDHI